MERISERGMTHLDLFSGAWRLDHSYKQNKSSGDLLSDELADFAYEITGNIYETTKTI